MKTVSKHSKLDDCGDSMTLTDETEPNTVDGSEASEDLDEELDELEKELLNWAEEKRPKTKSGKDSAPNSPRRSMSPKRTKSKSPKRNQRLPRVARARSAGELNRAHEVIETRMRRAFTLNSFEQEQKKLEESALMDGSAEENQKSPEDRLKQLLQGVDAKTFQSETWETYFKDVTPDRVAAHSIKVSDAIRRGNLDKLQQMHARGVPLDSCNAHGESMIHLACRLSKSEVVKFLVSEANVSVRVRDDCGRTPLHDACWTPNPDFKLIRFILNKSPELLFINDNRGFPALRYAPQSCWSAWSAFFEENLTFLRLKINHSEFLKSHCQLDDAQERLQALMKRAEKYSS